MRYKKKLILVFILIVIITVIQYFLPFKPDAVVFYDKYIFRPFQSFRNVVFSIIPISIGDLLYMVAGIILLIAIGRWVYFLVKVKTHGKYLVMSILNTVIIISIVYIFFFIGWGANYYKPSLTTYWNLDKTKWNDTATLVRFDEYLVKQLNACAPFYKANSFRAIDDRSVLYYQQYTDARTKLHGLNVKPSVFGYLMQHLEIQGYYNPFTGEAQVNRFLPSFMLPFVICHEMAHQAGIAAEDDANLLAYALGTRVRDANFNYSAYFNIWLYTQGRLRMMDSVKAYSIKKQLNPLSLSHLDTLRAIRRKYRGAVSDYSGYLYDSYLRMHNQKDGLGSYNKVTVSAWALDEQRKIMPDSLLNIP